MHWLSYLTNFGDPYLTVPLATLVALWLAAARALRVACIWSCGIALGAALVAASRIAHIVWGVELAALHFTVVSGHAMLAAAVYPTALALCDNRGRREHRPGPALAGLAFAAVIGGSRVLLGYHSTAEVISGLLSGACVAMLTCGHLAFARSRFARPRGFALPDPAPFAAAALAAVVMYHGKVAPVSASIDRNAVQLLQSDRSQAGKNGK
ncbi:phosphatase PAP2 family protein [Burkholderia plantarii]|nr:phosphatase PAP2 family protein [Burkholderia plantarii]